MRANSSGKSQDEWLWGWDPTRGIVSVFAEPNGRVLVWRRVASDRVICEEERFRPWLLLSSLDDLAHLGPRLCKEGSSSHPQAVTYRELSGQGTLRFLVRASDLRALTEPILQGARRRTGRSIRHVSELGESRVLSLPPEEQYLVDSGRTYFRGLDFGSLRRVQFDLETTGLDAVRDRIFLIALRTPDGQVQVLEAENTEDAAEAALIRALLDQVRQLDPDIIENHNLHGFDLPFLVERARRLRVPLALGRYGPAGLRLRAAATGRGIRMESAETGELQTPTNDRPRRLRYTTPGREFIDTLDAIRRQDMSAWDLSSRGLKAVARRLGLASAEREYIAGAEVHRVFLRDPERVRRYARQDVEEAAQIAEIFGGAAFALAQMAPRRYERLADAGPATGILDPLIARAYLHAGVALPAHQSGDGTAHSGAALHLFATGVAERIVKADVASLYPSLMREYRIGPASDPLGVMLALVDRLVDQRLNAKHLARELPKGTPERFTKESLSAAMKIVINSAYGYLGAVGLTRFADVHAANEVTRRGRELLSLICRELDSRGMTLLEADTDGVYFAVPEHYTEQDEQRIVSEVAALLPRQVRLETEGRYAAMLSHEPKNYALLPYDGPVLLRGVAFRSSRAEPFGEAFLRRALERLLRADVLGVRRIYVDTVLDLRRRALPTEQVTTLSRLTKASEQYLDSRKNRREFVYEALLLSGRKHWHAGERVRVYRAENGRPALLSWDPDEQARDVTPRQDPRDYDVEYYVRSLRVNFASRLERAFTAEHFELLFADPQQPSLFERLLAEARPLLTRHAVSLPMT